MAITTRIANFSDQTLGGITAANFDTNVQFVFTNTTASHLGLPQSDVQISSYHDVTTREVVRLLGVGVAVNYIIIIPPSGSGSTGSIINITTIQSTVSSATFTQSFISNLQTYAATNNITSLTHLLATVNITVSSATVTLLSNAPTLAPTGSSGSSKSKNTDTLVIETVVPIVGFFVLAGVAYGIYYYYHYQSRKHQVAQVYAS